MLTAMKRSPLVLTGALLLPFAAAAASSCGGDEEPSATGVFETTSSGSGGAGGAGSSTSTGEGGDLFGDGGTDECTSDGTPCDLAGDGDGVCAGGVCCDAEKACGMSCCSATDVCSFQQCVTPGALCIDATECPDGYYCEYALGDPGGAGGAGGAGPGCQGGVVPATGKCLPKPPECPPGVEPDPSQPLTCLAPCEYKPPVGQFQPVLKYSWGSPLAPSNQDSVMMAPVVIQLDDDTCDGVVDERDIPEIVFSTFTAGNYNGNGTLHAISIVGGQVVDKWSHNAPVSPNHPGRSIAAGNIDGLPGNEIVVCTTDLRVRAYRADGTELWLSPPGTACIMPSLADLDQNGDVEVVVESQILDGVTGQPEVAAFSPANTDNIVVSDVDGDGKLDIVTPNRAYRADGSLIADTGQTATYVAVGDLDEDGVPEIIAANKPAHELLVWHVDPVAPGGFKVIRLNVDINGPLSPSLCNAGSAGNTTGGGPPTVADFNGDGTPDVALAGGVGYAVLDGKKLMDQAVTSDQTVLWITQTQDCSSAATGSSVFDFEGDGKAEVVYGDEVKFHVYSGVDGSVLFETCNTNGTLVEYPLVADVDNDGQADIILVSNSYSNFACPDGSKTAGVRIFGDANGNWVRTRRVWNQHGYHVTNVEEDGTIPTVEAANIASPKLNNFRQNIQPSGEFSAPDLVVSVTPRCTSPYGLVARVRNLGEASAPAGIPVGFYAGDPAAGGTLLGSGATTKALYSAEAEDVVLDIDAPVDVQNGTTPVFVVVDDGMPMHTWHECRTDNNVGQGTGKCDGVD